MTARIACTLVLAATLASCVGEEAPAARRVDLHGDVRASGPVVSSGGRLRFLEATAAQPSSWPGHIRVRAAILDEEGRPLTSPEIDLGRARLRVSGLGLTRVAEMPDLGHLLVVTVTGGSRHYYAITARDDLALVRIEDEQGEPRGRRSGAPPVPTRRWVERLRSDDFVDVLSTLQALLGSDSVVPAESEPLRETLEALGARTETPWIAQAARLALSLR